MTISPTFPGYPGSIGAKVATVFWHAGPSSYVQVTAVAGTVPVTGGDTVQAVEASLKYFDWMSNGISDDGCFAVEAIPVAPSNTPGQVGVTCKLRWKALVTATIGGQNQTAGSEAVAGTNLSAENVRFHALGI